MDKYMRVEKPKVQTEIRETEIRITTQGKMRNYISYATNLFQQKGATEITLKAMGRAINKTVTIAEIVKRRIPGIHQVTQIDSTDITDLWEPVEEGLYQLETTRHVSSIQITLSTLPLDTTAPGYQPPLPLDQVHPINIEEDSSSESDTESSEPKSKSKSKSKPAAPQPNAQPPTSKNAQGGRGGPGKGGRGGSERGRGRGGAVSTVPRDAAPAGAPTEGSTTAQPTKARSSRGRGGRGGAAPVGVGAPVPYYMDVRRQLDDMYRPGPTLAIPPNAIPAGYVPVIAPTSLPIAVPHYQGGRGRGGHAAGLPLMPVPITMVPIHQSQAIHHPFQQQGMRGGRGGRGGRGDGTRGGHRGGRGGKGGARGNTTTATPGTTPTPATSSSQSAEQQPQSIPAPAAPAPVPSSSTPASASSSTEPSAAS